MNHFTHFTNPGLVFGPGCIEKLPGLIRLYGDNALIVTGARSFVSTPFWQKLKKALASSGVQYTRSEVSSEPSPDMVDQMVQEQRKNRVDVVVAIGGGSVLDAGKAVSAMMGKSDSVRCYLEGVGSKTHDGSKRPFIAVPTTAGTGSEATKNAVISSIGKNGFKKSLRHDAFVPDMALVDPELTVDTPFSITAACGMDAVTQLIESFVSTHATPMTDALVRSALAELGDALIQACTEDPGDVVPRSRLSYAAYVSGVALANAGLGLVHGYAGVLGGLFDIPHGVACGTLLAPVCKWNIAALKKEDPRHPALKKYGEAGALLDPSCRYGRDLAPDDPQRLTQILDALSEQLKMPGLSQFGILEADLVSIAAQSSLKHNPVRLCTEELVQILRSRL